MGQVRPADRLPSQEMLAHGDSQKHLATHHQTRPHSVWFLREDGTKPEETHLRVTLLFACIHMSMFLRRQQRRFTWKCLFFNRATWGKGSLLFSMFC